MRKTKLRITPIDKHWKNFELLTDYQCTSGTRIPKGFITNFASSPKILWWIVSPMGSYGYAALEHDYLYSIADIPRKNIDKIFYQAMKRHEVKLWKRLPIYYAVRLFGGKYYKQEELKNENTQ